MSDENKEALTDAVDNVGGSAVEETPEHTPENTETEAVADEAPAEGGDETSEAQSPPLEGQPDLEDAPEPDLFEDRPLNVEAVQKLRVSKAERAQLVQLVEQAEKDRTLVDQVGGEFGVNALKPLAELVSKASATSEDIDAVMDALFKANAPVTQRLADEIADNYMRIPQLAERSLVKAFGPNATYDNIKELLAFDDAGIIDHEDGKSLLATDSEVIAKRESEKEQLKREVAELKAQLANPEARVEPQAEKAVKEFESDFYGETPKVLEKYFKQLNWDADGTLAKIVTEVLQSRLTRDTRYTETEKYLKTTGVYRAGANRVALADSNLHLLKNLTEAQGKELIRSIQADIRKISENSRNAIQVKKAEDKKAAEKEAAPVALPPPNETAEQRIARLDAKFKGRLITNAA